MVSKTKLFTQLDHMEEELRERLVPHLTQAAKGHNALVFCTTDFNPFPELKHQVNTETDELIQLGRKILTLSEKLGEPTQGTIAERLCWYCRKWGDCDNSHRKAAQGLAAEFLQEMAGNSQ